MPIDKACACGPTCQDIGDGCRYLESECHCGKDGHALNSVNCPVHGYETVTKSENVAQEWVDEYVALRDKLANFLPEFKKSAASVNLLCGPRPGGKSKDWLDGQDRGLRQGLHIAETIVKALLEDEAKALPRPERS